MELIKEVKNFEWNTQVLLPKKIVEVITPQMAGVFFIASCNKEVLVLTAYDGTIYRLHVKEIVTSKSKIRILGTTSESKEQCTSTTCSCGNKCSHSTTPSVERYVVKNGTPVPDEDFILNSKAYQDLTRTVLDFLK